MLTSLGMTFLVTSVLEFKKKVRKCCLLAIYFESEKCNIRTSWLISRKIWLAGKILNFQKFTYHSVEIMEIYSHIFLTKISYKQLFTIEVTKELIWRKKWTPNHSVEIMEIYSHTYLGDNFENVTSLLSKARWKFHDFCITHILREINFVDSWRAKTAIKALLGAVNFVLLVNFSLQKVNKCIKIKIQSHWMCSNGWLRTSRILKIDFT